MSEAAFAPGTTVAGKYRIERLIGEGAMGEIYAARDTELERDVAVKVLHREIGHDEKVIGRFMREARVAARLETEHVARIHDFGVSQEHGTFFVAFELLKGEDLGAMLQREGPAPIPLAVDRIVEALAGVAAAHVQGIVHRDLKPANLFRVVAEDGRETIKVLDFGIAKAVKGSELGKGPQTSTASLVGSPLYMSPEQLRSSKDVDVRADIWSMGVTLYELITGRPPFDGATLGMLLRAVLDGRAEPPEKLRPDVPPELSAVIMKCLASDRERRFASVRELATALASFGTQRSHAAVLEIDDVFGSETMKATNPVSSPSLPVMAAPPSTPAIETRPREPRASGVGLKIALVAVALVVLAVAGFVGFRLSGP